MGAQHREIDSKQAAFWDVVPRVRRSQTVFWQRLKWNRSIVMDETKIGRVNFSGFRFPVSPIFYGVLVMVEIIL